MKIPCQLSHGADGRWSAVHESADVGRVEVHASTREQALQKLEGEVRYRLELCPCSGESYRHIDLQVETR
jgi:hypothetical protein